MRKEIRPTTPITSISPSLSRCWAAAATTLHPSRSLSQSRARLSTSSSLPPSHPPATIQSREKERVRVRRREGVKEEQRGSKAVVEQGATVTITHRAVQRLWQQTRQGRALCGCCLIEEVGRIFYQKVHNFRDLQVGHLFREILYETN